MTLLDCDTMHQIFAAQADFQILVGDRKITLSDVGAGHLFPARWRLPDEKLPFDFLMSCHRGPFLRESAGSRIGITGSRLIATFGGIAAVVTVLGFFGSLWWIFDLFEFGIGYGAKIGRQDDHRQIGEIWSKP
jgi:hypothetical protein